MASSRVFVIFLFFIGTFVAYANGAKPPEIESSAKEVKCEETARSIRDRAMSSQIIFHGLAVYTSPANLSVSSIEKWTSDGYYLAHFWLISVYKGATYIAQHLKIPDINGNTIYNIHDKKVNVSGFYRPREDSRRRTCWKPVTSQKYYIIFAELQNDELNSFTDEYASAAIDWTEQNERYVSRGMGWGDWSEWAPCTATCGEGIQERSRFCLKPPCSEYNKERRRCNMFSCDGTVEPLSTNNQRYFYPPHAVWERVTNRRTAWHIKPNYYLWLPATQVAFPVNDFQKHFALLLSVRIDPMSRTEGTIFSLRSRREKNRFLSLTLSDQDVLRLVHSTPNGTQSVIIPAIITDGHWHQLALGIQDDVSVRSYLDCRWVSTDILKSTSLGNSEDADLIIGYLFTGDIEHLILVPDAGAVVQQCSNTKTAILDTDLKVQNKESFVENPVKHIQIQRKKHHVSETPTTEKLLKTTTIRHPVSNGFTEGEEDETDDDGSEDDRDEEEGSGFDELYSTAWSSWSECGIPCGKGVQIRTLQCLNINSKVIPCPRTMNNRLLKETRPCRNNIKCRHGKKEKFWKKKHSIRGKIKAYNDEEIEIVNGHRIIPEDTWKHIKRCNCLNDGICEENSKMCICPPEYTGSACETRINGVCYPECQNRGICGPDRKCICPDGYTGDVCQERKDSKPITGGMCNCPENTLTGWSYWNNKTVLCRTCQNDGVCVRNKCKCVPGWIGDDCSVAMCDPPCHNGGFCSKPNQCLCHPGYIGDFCEKDICGNGCLNGGICVGINLCKCPQNTTGKFCEKGICDPPCKNGATCAPGNRCLCDTNVTGLRCEKKLCKYKAVKKPYTIGVRRLAKRKQNTECESNQPECNIRSVPKYQTIYRTEYHTVYECTD